MGPVEEDGKKCGGSRGAEGRRPADVFLPAWSLGKPACLDFAVTSGLSMGALHASAQDGAAATTEYAARKQALLDTASHCTDEGLDFIPMIVEASGGGWGADACQLFHTLSKSAARLTGDTPSDKLEQFHQSLSVCLHRANARAIWRRSPAAAPICTAIAGAQAALSRAEAERFATDMDQRQ
eukprot:gene19521-biopygen901